MREIKFRGRERESNKWVFGYVRHWKCCYGDEWHIQGENDNVHIVITETIGQFTGLLDSNGKEIYEGDIVKVNGWRKPTLVEWFDANAQFVIDGSLNLGLRNSFMQVIGNIYDSPELLEGDDARD